MKLSKTIKLEEELSKLKVYCKCGHSLIIPLHESKQLCSWCGHYVFRDKKEEFIYKFKLHLKGIRR